MISKNQLKEYVNSGYDVPEIAEMIKKCMRIGFDSYIIADPALILYLRKQHIDCEIHLSGETAEVNTGMVDIFQQMKLKRVIFHRKNTIEDMKSVITHVRRQNIEWVGSYGQQDENS